MIGPMVDNIYHKIVSMSDRSVVNYDPTYKCLIITNIEYIVL